MVTDIEKLDGDLREVLSKERYSHSVCVMQMCEKLAKKYNANVEKAKLIGLMHDMAKEVSNKEKLDYVKKNNIACNEIIFCKSQGHTCFIYTDSDTYQTTKYKLSMLEQFINSCDFYMINRSCLINWNYVYKIDDKNIVLENKTILKISKNRYKNVLLAYQKYIKRNLI